MHFHALPGFPSAAARLVLGTASFGSQIPRAEAFELLDAYRASGGNFIDTAHVYGAWAPEGANGGEGNSEVVVGEWMRVRGCREEMIVATKGGHPDFRTGESTLRPEALMRQLGESLERLGTDAVDLYLLHRDDPTMPVEELLEPLLAPLRSGQIRAIGCSHWRVERMAAARALADQTGLPLLSVDQLAHSLASRNESRMSDRFGEQLSLDAELERFHAETDLPLMAFSSQALGFFAAKYDAVDWSEAGGVKRAILRQYVNPRNLSRRARARVLAQRHACSTNQIALAWLMQEAFPVFPILGPNNAEQLHDSLGAPRIELTPEEHRWLGSG